MSGSTPSTATASAVAGFRDPDAYEQVMGRWSRRFAPTLLRFGGVGAADRVLDVGCGTGSLILSVPEVADVARVVGIDPTEAYVARLQARITDPRLSAQLGDARALPFADDSFDRTYAMFVLMLIPDADRALADMIRVTRKGGTVTAATWDSFGSLTPPRLVWNAAMARDPDFVPPLFRPFNTLGDMASAWRGCGLLDVEETTFLVRQEFANFDEFWHATIGEGPQAVYIESLPQADRAGVMANVRRAYCANQPDGPRSFACAALACRGTVP